MKGYKMETERKKKGFTIVELLTVMAIIALLLGILAPALRMVRRIAKDVGQKAQFHSIDVALETYSGETEQYPDSTIRPSIGGEPTGSGPFTVGAHHLAEALLGRDMLGFDPWTHWDAEIDKSDPDIYAAKPPSLKASTNEEVTKSLDRRKGPYLSSDSVEAYQIAQLYDTPGDVYHGNLNRTGTIDNSASPAPVLTDSYRVKAVSLPGGKQVKAGTPILYYRANITSREFRNSTLPVPGTISDPCAAASIFNSFDNEELLKLGTIMDQTKYHHFDPVNYTSGRELFYDAITNPTITTQVRPYNQTSYILISAGFDGIFGTPDDIYNFSQ
ncbi:MAG: type II secretion system GspH family protein [Sedimentisphaerales bacterium]|nr:type II secretion system GspH family protein [Sedimentisphaerales bacterium]